jgi:predicted nucleic acid-binding protein
MNSVFLDTVGLLALWDEDDQWHAAAERAFAGLVREHARLVTSGFVLLECGNAAARRPYRSAVDDLRVEMEAKGRIIAPNEQDLAAAWHAYRRGDAS